jgi:serine/threonine-protein kinase RIM15
MSDSSHPRRQPPSPLVFSPDSALPAIPLQSQTSTSSSHGSGANTVSMPFVRRHVYRRLKAAKQECDKELQRVTNSITAFFEERLRDNDHEQEFEREQREANRERDRDSRADDIEPLREPFVLQPAALRSALQFDEVSSDGGYEAEPEGSNSRGRQRAFMSQNHCIGSTILTELMFCQRQTNSLYILCI